MKKGARLTTAAPSFFREEPLPQRSTVALILAGESPLGAEPITLPDSREATVIAPDLSNLPPGAKAIDPSTGEIVGHPEVDPGRKG